MVSRFAGVLAAVLAAGCDPYPPHDALGARGALARRPVCGIYPDDGFARVAFEGGYEMEVTLPPFEDFWDRTPAFMVWEDAGGCAFRMGGSSARVQFGGLVDGYRPLFLEALVFRGADACSLCDPSDCRTFEASSAERLYLWCGSPREDGR